MNRAARWAASHVGLLVVLAIAVAIGEVPRVLAACCAPPGATGLGTAWFINDFAQYESAMRQGATQSGWLIHDPFTSEANPAAFMFPLYVGMGKLAATLRVAPTLVEHVVEILARVLLVVSLWRFAHAFTSTRTAAHWAFALALFGSGFELFAGLASGALANLGLTVYTGNWSYETNTFGLLFAAPHVPLAMAATLELARDGLRPRQRVTWPWVLKTALLGAAVAMLDAFHVPVLLGAIGIAGLVFWGSGRGVANLAGALVAAIAALPVLWPTIATFSFQTFWVTTYSTQNVLPSPLPHELLVDLGPTL
ncbi:MAG: hypothetical protein JO057_25920, partial [Chloroflexi bacterium]|nr:hypothetical protein [Chloroflexota bacterium]